MQLNKGITVIVLTLSLLACNNEPKSQAEHLPVVDQSAEDDRKLVSSSLAEPIEKKGIRLTAVRAEVSYPMASLSLKQAKSSFKTAGLRSFNFEVNDFNLKAQSGGKRSQELANSEKGQHIHFILNNGPYMAKYNASFDAELSEGNNVVLAFLARSYHESVKNGKAFVFQNIAIGEDLPKFDEQAPHLIYSRPKGSYDWGKKKKLLLDFYLLNAKLSEDGMKVLATIDGIEFTLDSWYPYIIEGLEAGEHTFRLQLIDKDGSVVPGPFNDSGVRIVQLLAD